MTSVFRAFPWLIVLLFSSTTLAGEQPVLIRVEQIRFHLTKGGRGWVEALTVWSIGSAASAVDDLDAGDFDVLGQYGVKNRKTRLTKFEREELRVTSHGYLMNIMQFVRILNSGVPFLLSRDQTFDIRWDGNVFELRMAYEDDDTQRPTIQKDWPIIEITTDGRFTERTTGELSQNRSKTRIDAGVKRLLLEIEGLGAGDWDIGSSGNRQTDGPKSPH